MKKRILSICLIVGILINLVYQLINHFMKIGDAVAIPMCIVSITLMMIGIAYHGWCFGKHKNPYTKE